MATADQQWRVLHVASLPNQPKLFVKYHSTSMGYHLCLTDLVYLWTEQLDRRQIVKRALNNEIAIDPSEDVEQFKILLQKLYEGIESTDEKSTKSLSPGENEQDLKLTLSTTLPHPLPTLQWSFYLKRSSPGAFSEGLLMPSLAAQDATRVEINSLMVGLEEKDHIIGKLLDKLEASGTDLLSIFPGASKAKVGRKQSARQTLENSVKGFALFQRYDRRSDRSSLVLSGDLDVKSILPQNLTPDNLNLDNGVDLNWWTRLDNKHQLSQSHGQGRNKVLASSPRNDSRAKQGLKASATPDSAKHGTDDDATESEDEQRFTCTPSKHSPAASDGTGTGAIWIADVSSPTSNPGPDQTTKRKIGMLGGRSIKHSLTLEPVNVPQNHGLMSKTVSDAEASPKPRSRLGTIGGKKRPDPSEDAGAQSRGFTELKPTGKPQESDQPPEPEESAEIKANRKREELKKQLEEQVKAPKKKKRRF
ncbi:MAG: hypothetical protein M1834_007689 [Cirrosporium novae-zelandiae]|nr:MAG: hypothetical protein M1834_007689 [Cirrosporium novae-zelandiae]